MALFGVSTTPPVTRLVVGSRFGWVIPKHLRNFYLIVSRRLSSARTSKPVLQRANGPVTRWPLVICTTNFTPFAGIILPMRSEERRVGKSVSVRVELGGRRIIKKKTQ